jgi:hypothetical protein
MRREECGLADPRLALEQQDRRPTEPDLVQDRAKRLDFSFTSDHRVARIHGLPGAKNVGFEQQK